MEEKLDARPHKLELLNREKGSVTGIQDVVSFDENQMILDTNMGLLTVRGKALHVSRLTLEKGEVDIDGRIDSLTYSEQTASAGSKAESLLSRCFGDG